MPYAVYLEVDAETSHSLVRLSDMITRLNPSVLTPLRFKHSHHLTIAVYKNIATDKVVETLTSMLEESSKLDIHIPGVGCFPGENSVLFAAPTPTKKLIHFHEAYHQLVGPQDGSLPYYSPGSWFPHITIASGMNARQAVDAFSSATENWKTIKGYLVSAKIVSLTPTRVIWSSDFL